MDQLAKLKQRYLNWSWEQFAPSTAKSKVLRYLPVFLVIIFFKHFLNLSDYRLKRESIRFFELSNRSYAEKKLRKCDRLLRIAFGLLDSNFPSVLATSLRDSVATTLREPDKRVVTSESIFVITKNLESSLFDATGWYQLSRGLFCLGYFRAAWIAREKSLDLSIVEGSNSGSSVTVVSRAIEAHLERLDLDSLRKLLFANECLGLKALDSFRESLGWLEGNATLNSAHEIEKHGVSGSIFHNLVYGKRVVLVGPGSAQGEHGVEIDSADTVARIKYPGADYLLDRDLLGKRCEISQYPNLDPLRELSKFSSYEFFDDVRLIVSGEVNSSPIRNTPVFSENQELPMYRTTATSGMRLLVSLIRRSPSSLRIFGFNFYVDREPYNFGMKSFYEQSAWKMGDGYLFGTRTDYPKVEITSSFGAHDPVSNFCFAQNLYKAGLFDIEPYGKSILELTPYQYVERLEEMLGDW